MFIIAFVALVALNSFGVIPGAVIEVTSEVSRWALLTAIAAVGLKTSLKDVMQVGPAAISLLVLQTVFIAVFTLAGILWLSAQ